MPDGHDAPTRRRRLVRLPWTVLAALLLAGTATVAVALPRHSHQHFWCRNVPILSLSPGKAEDYRPQRLNPIPPLIVNNEFYELRDASDHVSPGRGRLTLDPSGRTVSFTAGDGRVVTFVRTSAPIGCAA